MEISQLGHVPDGFWYFSIISRYGASLTSLVLVPSILGLLAVLVWYVFE